MSMRHVDVTLTVTVTGVCGHAATTTKVLSVFSMNQDHAEAALEVARKYRHLITDGVADMVLVQAGDAGQGATGRITLTR